MTNHLPFADMLRGGHPNSLGRTVEVVEAVLAAPAQLDQLYGCYFDGDETVRLRTSNAMKRLWRQQPDWFRPYLDRFYEEVAALTQPSTRWTLAQMALELAPLFTDAQRQRAIMVLKDNLTQYDDWIVLSQTLKALEAWAETDADLREWLAPQLERLAADPRKSVAAPAAKLLKRLRG